MNTRAKGNRTQLKAIKELEHCGWLVDKVERSGKFEMSKDLFGLFDLVAINKDSVKFIQVTCNKPHTHKRYVLFRSEYNIPVSIEQWVWYDNKGWKKWWYNGKDKKLVEVFDRIQ